MKAIAEFENLYIHRAPVDMRKNVNGLAAIVEAELKLNLRASSLFVFCNGRRNLVKILYFDRSGFALWLKKLDDSKFPWPSHVDEETIAASHSELQFLLEGVSVWTRFKEVHFEQIL